MPRWVKLLALWEGFWWARRSSRRLQMYRLALERAKITGKPLMVVGAPDGGMTGGYPCGDLTVDLEPSSCPNSVQLDITQPLPFFDDSYVIVVMCVLEYVKGGDFLEVLRELDRVSGGDLFVVRVEPWTLTQFLYPNTVRSVPCDGEDCVALARRR